MSAEEATPVVTIRRMSTHSVRFCQSCGGAANLRLVIDGLRRRSEAALRALDMIPIGMLLSVLEDHPVIVNRYARDLLSNLRSNSENLLSSSSCSPTRLTAGPKRHAREAFTKSPNLPNDCDGYDSSDIDPPT